MSQEIFSHNGTIYKGSLKSALNAYKAMNRSYLMMGVLHDAEAYTFEDYLKDNYETMKP